MIHGAYLHLQREKQQKSLYAVVPPVHKVPQEEVVLVRTLSPHLEQLHEVVELPVDIPAYLRPYTIRVRVRKTEKKRKMRETEAGVATPS